MWLVLNVIKTLNIPQGWNLKMFVVKGIVIFPNLYSFASFQHMPVKCHLPISMSILKSLLYSRIN